MIAFADSCPRIFPRLLFKSPITSPSDVFRCKNYDLHDRFKDHRLRFTRRILYCHRSANLKGHLVRVNIMVRTKYDRNFNVDQSVTSQNTRCKTFFDTFDDAGIYSFGITPPTILLTTSLPLPASFGSISTKREHTVHDRQTA